MSRHRAGSHLHAPVFWHKKRQGEGKMNIPAGSQGCLMGKVLDNVHRHVCFVSQFLPMDFTLAVRGSAAPECSSSAALRHRPAALGAAHHSFPKSF